MGIERSLPDLLGEMEALVLRASCPAIRQSDEVMCPHCGCRWSLDEDRPECPSTGSRPS